MKKHSGTKANGSGSGRDENSQHFEGFAGGFGRKSPEFSGNRRNYAGRLGLHWSIACLLKSVVRFCIITFHFHLYNIETGPRI
jgi:hypothetical protein